MQNIINYITWSLNAIVILIVVHSFYVSYIEKDIFSLQHIFMIALLIINIISLTIAFYYYRYKIIIAEYKMMTDELLKMNKELIKND